MGRLNGAEGYGVRGDMQDQLHVCENSQHTQTPRESQAIAHLEVTQHQIGLCTVDRGVQRLEKKGVRRRQSTLFR